jgi:hypothetical protein
MLLMTDLVVSPLTEFPPFVENFPFVCLFMATIKVIKNIRGKKWKK